MEVALQSVALASTLVRDSTIRVEVGTLAAIDVVQARSQEATQRQALVQAEAIRDRTELALKRLIVSGPTDPNWMAVLDPVDRPTFTATVIDTAATVQRALNERTDWSHARKALEINSVTARYLRNQLLPQVVL